MRNSPPPSLATISRPRSIVSACVSRCALARSAPGFFTSHPPSGFGTTSRPLPMSMYPSISSQEVSGSPSTAIRFQITTAPPDEQLDVVEPLTHRLRDLVSCPPRGLSNQLEHPLAVVFQWVRAACGWAELLHNERAQLLGQLG